ncbi:DNA-binding MarR family transcriptional regulator [Streptomyces africanus]|uniref:DNA-binding MarR family transcriptional regulator n=1 Tax=Streptomyces africanus TaxID=231024 RepID=A0ABU0QFH4_9ACTN|nr:MarR family winged helix-turn-helix transcriptional regulator [Streptomyces africanus]MDQ0746141.1 DNA-binding MarR family transcriptional regulator [Streptomyces africanus]
MTQPEKTDASGSATARTTASAGGPLPLPPSVAAGPLSHAILRVARVHRMLAGQLLRRVGLHPGQELVMMQLWDRGPQRQTDLVRLLGSDAATMTRTIQRLENAGFVRRRPSTSDKRATIVEPTAASNALRQEVEHAWLDLEASVVNDLTPKEQAEALEALSRIEAGLTRAATQVD